MAKTTKPKSNDAAPQAAAKATKKTTGKAKSAGPATIAGIDTTQAAQDAARMLLARSKGTAELKTRNTAAFEQLKNSAGKSSLDSLLKDSASQGSKKSVASHHAGRQVSRNQTTGGEPHRFVPRRTGTA